MKFVAFLFTSLLMVLNVAFAEQGIKQLSEKNRMCSMTAEQAPSIRSFRLGMTVKDVALRLNSQTGSAVLGQLAQWKARPTYTGLFGIEITSQQFASLQESEGIKYITFNFLNERLYQYRVDYFGEAKWQNIKQFVDLVSPTLKLHQKWEMPNDRTASLDCGGFKIDASLNGMLGEPSLTITDNWRKQETVKRKEESTKKKQEEEEKRRRDFKP